MIGALACGVVVYGLLVLKWQAFTEEDLDLLQSGIAAFGRIGSLLDPLFRLARTIQKS
jgi:hypothetical protein